VPPADAWFAHKTLRQSPLSGDRLSRGSCWRPHSVVAASPRPAWRLRGGGAARSPWPMPKAVTRKATGW